VVKYLVVVVIEMLQNNSVAIGLGAEMPYTGYRLNERAVKENGYDCRANISNEVEIMGKPQLVSRLSSDNRSLNRTMEDSSPFA